MESKTERKKERRAEKSFLPRFLRNPPFLLFLPFLALLQALLFLSPSFNTAYKLQHLPCALGEERALVLLGCEAGQLAG
jgi:hypothetical protein